MAQKAAPTKPLAAQLQADVLSHKVAWPMSADERAAYEVAYYANLKK